MSTNLCDNFPIYRIQTLILAFPHAVTSNVTTVVVAAVGAVVVLVIAIIIMNHKTV